MTVEDPDAIALLEDGSGRDERSVTVETAAWLGAFTLLVGAVLGGFVVHGFGDKARHPAASGPVTVVRKLVAATPVTTRTAVAHKTLYVRRTVTKAPSTQPSAAAPVGATGSVVAKLDTYRARSFEASAKLQARARACAHTNAVNYQQQTCSGAAWSAVLSGDDLTDADFARAVIDQNDGAWKSKRYHRAAAASAAAKNGRVFWVLILA